MDTRQEILLFSKNNQCSKVWFVQIGDVMLETRNQIHVMLIDMRDLV